MLTPQLLVQRLTQTFGANGGRGYDLARAVAMLEVGILAVHASINSFSALVCVLACFLPLIAVMRKAYYTPTPCVWPTPSTAVVDILTETVMYCILASMVSAQNRTLGLNDSPGCLDMHAAPLLLGERGV